MQEIAPQKNDRDFKGVWIPAAIWESESLSLREKCLLVEIDSLDKGQGCYASNAYLGKFLGISEGQTANMITDLRKRGHVITIKFDGRTRYLKVVQENLNVGFRKTLTEGSGKPEGCLKENLKLYIRKSNTVINTEEDSPDGGGGEEKNKNNSEQTTTGISSEEEMVRMLEGVPKKLENNIKISQDLPPNPKKKMALPPKPIKKTSVDPKVVKEVPMLINADHLEIFEYYKKNIFLTCNKKTKGIVEGIPRALNIFRSYYGDQAKAKLLEALEKFTLKMSTSDWWKKAFENSTAVFMLAPTNFFSVTSVENKLLALTINPKSNDKSANRHLLQRATTEEERRKVKEFNQRNLDAYMARNGKVSD